MRLQIEGGTLTSAVKWAAQLAPDKPPTPVMAGVQLTASGDQLQVSATNGDTFGTLTVPATVQTEGQIIVSAKLLATITATIPKTGKATLEHDGSRLAVRCGTLWRLPELGGGADTWATFPELGDLVGEIPADVLSRAVSRVLPAVNPDADKLEIRGMCWETGESLTLAATDRYRLPVAEVEWKRADDVTDQQLIVAADLLKTVTDSMNGGKGTVEIYSDGNMIGFVLPPYQVIGRLIAGTYLKYQPIFASPESKAATRVTVDIAELSLAVTQASAVAKTGFDLLRLAVTPDGIEVSLHAEDTDAESNAVESRDWSGESLTVGITARYLLEALSCLGSPMAVMTFIGEGSKPYMLRPADKDGQIIADGYGHVLMTRSLSSAGVAS